MSEDKRKGINKEIESLIKEIDRETFLYVNYPFCSGSCRFCIYKIGRYTKAKSESYLKCYKKEIKLYEKLLPNFKFKNIHIGGGTPNLVSPELLLTPLKKLVDFKKTRHSVIEIFPKPDLEGYLKKLKKYNISKVQLGIQTLSQDILKSEKRFTPLKIILSSLKTLSESGLVWSVDLAYGFKDEKRFKRDYIAELKEVLEYRPAGFHLYLMRSEDRNLYYKGKRRKEVDFGVNISGVEKILSENGYKIIGDEWCRGKNISYAQKTICYDSKAEFLSPSILGIGLGAVSFHRFMRYVNLKDLGDYKKCLGRRFFPVVGFDNFKKNNFYPVVNLCRIIRINSRFDLKGFLSSKLVSKRKKEGIKTFINYLKENKLEFKIKKGEMIINQPDQYGNFLYLVNEYIKQERQAIN
ncbi:MAG: radical SAM protein [Candidatus Portnoybacteria bacterium]